MRWTASLFICFAVFGTALSTSLENLQCLICQQVITDLHAELKGVDPKKTIDVGNYRVGESPNTVPYALSSMHIADSLEKVCTGIDDYVRATHKKTGELLLFKLIVEGGGMNPEMTNVDIIQDGDLNKSLKYYCDGLVEENEEDITEMIQNEESDIGAKLCHQKLKLCSRERDTNKEEL